MFVFMSPDCFGGATFCPSTVKMICFVVYEKAFVHERITLGRRAESFFARRIALAFSCRPALASHATHSGQTPVSVRFATP